MIDETKIQHKNKEDELGDAMLNLLIKFLGALFIIGIMSFFLVLWIWENK